MTLIKDDLEDVDSPPSETPGRGNVSAKSCPIHPNRNKNSPSFPKVYHVKDLENGPVEAGTPKFKVHPLHVDVSVRDSKVPFSFSDCCSYVDDVSLLPLENVIRGKGSKENRSYRGFSQKGENATLCDRVDNAVKDSILSEDFKSKYFSDDFLLLSKDISLWNNAVTGKDPPDVLVSDNPATHSPTIIGEGKDKKSVVMKVCEYESEKAERIEMVLRKQIEQRDLEICKLNEIIHEYKQWKDELEIGRNALVTGYKAANDTKSSISSQNLKNAMIENNTLKSKLQEMEQQHFCKDDLIRTLEQQLQDANREIDEKKSKIVTLTSENELMQDSIDGMNKLLRDREFKIQSSLSSDYRSHIESVILENKKYRNLSIEKQEEIEGCKILLKQAEEECANMFNEIIALRRRLEGKNLEIERWKLSMIELESKYVQNDKTSQLNAALQAQNELREKYQALKRNLKLMGITFDEFSQKKQ